MNPFERRVERASAAVAIYGRVAAKALAEGRGIGSWTTMQLIEARARYIEAIADERDDREARCAS